MINGWEVRENFIIISDFGSILTLRLAETMWTANFFLGLTTMAELAG